MTDTLYIIGNGFDLHHKIQSEYRHFGAYLKERDRKTYDVVERYFSVDAKFWAELEERLAMFDVDTLVDDASSFLVGYGADDWSDSYHHDYQYEINEAVEAISVKLRGHFADWIRQVPLPARAAIQSIKVPINPSGLFLNFNYTPTLQRLYDVADDRVLHIHGAALDHDAKLILGHGWLPPPKPQRQPPPDDIDDPYWGDDEDVRVTEGQEIIDDYFKSTFKPTAKVIRDNAAFFKGLGSVRRIFVMGHSVSEVDHPYFHEIINNIDADRVRWKVSYYGNVSQVRDNVGDLDLDDALVKYALLSEF